MARNLHVYDKRHETITNLVTDKHVHGSRHCFLLLVFYSLAGCDPLATVYLIVKSTEKITVFRTGLLCWYHSVVLTRESQDEGGFESKIGHPCWGNQDRRWKASIIGVEWAFRACQFIQGCKVWWQLPWSAFTFSTQLLACLGKTETHSRSSASISYYEVQYWVCRQADA